MGAFNFQQTVKKNKKIPAKKVDIVGCLFLP